MKCQSDQPIIEENEDRISRSDELCLNESDNDTNIVTSRLTLRKPHWDDIDAISILANNIAVSKMLSRMPYPYTRADAEEFVNKIAKFENGNSVYAITITKTGEFIGCCGIEKKNGQDHTDIGYWLGEPHWGHGYGTEAAHALVDKAFKSDGIESINASCRFGNIASRKVLQKSGFQFFGTGMNFCLAQNDQVPIELYRLERKVWASLKNWREKCKTDQTIEK